MAHLESQTFSNMKSRFRSACKIAGLVVEPGKNTGPLLDVWERLLGMIPSGIDRRYLRRFAHFAGRQGWRPEDITTEHMFRYFEWLKHHAINGSEWESYVRAAKRWNKLAKTIRGWPGRTVTIIRKRTPYMVTMDALHPALRAAILAYLDVLAGGGPVNEGDAPVFLKGVTRKSLSPVTINLRRTQIMQYVSALLDQGYPLDTLVSVDAVTTTKAIADAMDFFYHRAGGVMATQIRFIAMAVKGLLYHNISGSLRSRTRRDKDRQQVQSNRIIDPRIDLLDSIIDAAKPEDRGLVRKNKTCLAQFDDQRNLGALLHLPQRLLKDAARTGGKDGARLAESALAIELLTMCPIRIGNVVGLDLTRHFIKPGPSKNGTVRIVIPKGEVKNKREIEFEFPVHLARMHDRHITKFRPLLPGSGSNWLFPSVDGGERPYKSLAGQISRVVLRYTGLTITPHQFRHFAGMMFLDEHPTGHGTVRDVLGHASIDTTTQYYTGIDQVKAGRIYDKAILALRERTKFAAKKEKKS
jgi:integrase